MRFCVCVWLHVAIYLMCGPRQLFCFRCGPETPKGWTPCCRESVVYPSGCLVAWELRLSIAAQHHEKVWYWISLLQENIKIQNLKCDFYRMCITFTQSKVKKKLKAQILYVRDHLYVKIKQLCSRTKLKTIYVCIKDIQHQKGKICGIQLIISRHTI